MALIKCNHCGKLVSDRAVTCPHCGNNPKETIATTQEVLEKDEAVKSEVSHSDVNEDQVAFQTPQQAPNVAQEEIEEDTSSGASKTLVVIVAVLAAIAIVFGGYMWLEGRTGKTEAVPVDTVAVDTTNCGDVLEADTTGVVTEEPAVEADTISCDTEQHYAEEQGFNSNMDVRDFVIGNSYSCNGVTLRITEDGVFANDNEISQSRPVFRKLSSETGRITARPSISITVKRGDNKLVDNKSGDVYYFQY